MKSRLFQLLNSLDTSSDWVDAAIELLNSKDAQILSERAGIQKVKELSADLRIRSVAAQKARIRILGISVLLDTLNTMPQDEIVHNYVLKARNTTTIFYLDSADSKLVGSLVIRTA